MGIPEELGGLVGKVEELAREHPDQVNTVVDKAEALVDEKTGHKYTSQIHAGGEKASAFLEGPTGTATGSTAPAAATPDDPASTH